MTEKNAPTKPPRTAEQAIEQVSARHAWPLPEGGYARLEADEYEFGFVVQAVYPRPDDPTALPVDPGGSSVVVDSRTGAMTLWPNYPSARIAEIYREHLATKGS